MLSLLVVADETPETTLVRIVAVLLQTIDHADGAGVSLVKGRVIGTAAGTSDLQRRVDELQTETGQGPCFEAIREPDARVYRIDDMSDEERWPVFCRRASALGVQSTIAFVLGTCIRRRGALRSRDVIGRAKGILMARDGLTDDQAFARLREISQHLNMKLRDVAADMAATSPITESLS
jgi:hypothetical protein